MFSVWQSGETATATRPVRAVPHTPWPNKHSPTPPSRRSYAASTCWAGQASSPRPALWPASDQPNDQSPRGDRGQAYRQRLPRDAPVVAAEDGAAIGPSVDTLRVAGIPVDGHHHIVV